MKLLNQTGIKNHSNKTRLTELKDRAIRFAHLSRGKDRTGLTLVELAIVILVIGIIMTIVVVNLDFGVIDKAKIQQVKTQRNTFRSKMKIHSMEGNAPIQEGDKITILDGVDEDGGKDPFGRLYIFCRSDTGKMHICSLGADGEPGGEGENQDFFLTGQIKNWPAWLQNKKSDKVEVD